MAKEFDDYQLQVRSEQGAANTENPNADWLLPQLANYLAAMRLGFDRHHEYGPHNILKFKEMGVTMRLHDKLERLTTLVFNPPIDRTPEQEVYRIASIKDCLGDIINYANYGLMVLDNDSNGKTPFERPSDVDPATLSLHLMDSNGKVVL